MCSRFYIKRLEKKLIFSLLLSLVAMARLCVVIFILIGIFSSLNAVPFSDLFIDGRSESEFGNKFQGDIDLTPEQEAMMNGTRGGRTGLLNNFYRWPKNQNGYVVLPYAFEPNSMFCKKL